MSPSRRCAPRAPRTTTAVLVVLGLLLAGGCGVRLETPPPAPLTPGVDESARQRASADAVALEVVADPAGTTTDGPTDASTDPPTDPPTDPVVAARAAVATHAALHLDLLGGLYDDGLDPRAPRRPESPVATPSPTPAAVPPEAVVAALTEAAATARADLATVTDPGLARLLASLWVSRLLSASRLAAAAGLTPPPVPEVAVPAVLPAGLAGSDLATLVAAEDAAGYALEVVAAKHTGDLRSRAGARAVVHRERAEAWAEAGEVDGTGLDPRRVAYALPGGLEDPAVAGALVADVQTTLADDYLSLVAEVAPDERATMADAVAEATAQAVAWGAALPALPGMPEHADR